MKIKIESEEGTRLLAGKIAYMAPQGITIGLAGELGAGKTTFTRYFCQALQVNEPVSSPTYVLEHEYTSGTGILVDHWDLYRISERPEELYLPVESNCIRIIEWVGKVPDLADEANLILTISFLESSVNEGSRLFDISGPLCREIDLTEVLP